MNKETTWHRLATVGVAASAAVFVGGAAWQAVGSLAPVLGLFFGGWLLACVLEPVVCRVACRTRVSRPTAVLETYVALIAVSVVTLIVIGPVVGAQLGRSMGSFPAQADAAVHEALDAQALANTWLAQSGLPLHVDILSSASPGDLVGELGSRVDSAEAVTAGMQSLGDLGMMLLLSVFFLLGGPQLAEQVVGWSGTRAAPDVRFVLGTVHDTFEGFARAQLVQAALFAAGVWICLAAAQVESAPLVAVVAGAFLIIPIVGSALAIVIPLVATLLWNPAAAIVVGVALVLLEQLVLNVIGPRLMSRQLGLPPLLVLFGILAGGQIAGFFGAVFGIPALATLMSVVDHFRAATPSSLVPENDGYGNWE